MGVRGPHALKHKTRTPPRLEPKAANGATLTHSNPLQIPAPSRSRLTIFRTATANPKELTLIRGTPCTRKTPRKPTATAERKKIRARARVRVRVRRTTRNPNLNPASFVSIRGCQPALAVQTPHAAFIRANPCSSVAKKTSLPEFNIRGTPRPPRGRGDGGEGATRPKTQDPNPASTGTKSS